MNEVHKQHQQGQNLPHYVAFGCSIFHVRLFPSVLQLGSSHGKSEVGSTNRGTLNDFTGFVSALWRLQPCLFASPHKTR